MRANDTHAEAAHALDGAGVGISRNVATEEGARARGVYVAECVRPDGSLRWREEYRNVVTTQGKNDALDKYLSGSGYTAAWYIGLIDAGSYSAVSANDTAASHSGWTENTGYSGSTRPVASFASASGGSKSLSAAASFAISANSTIKGSTLISNSSKGGTSGILYSAGLFTGGDKVVQSGDTLNVTYTASL